MHFVYNAENLNATASLLMNEQESHGNQPLEKAVEYLKSRAVIAMVNTYGSRPLRDSFLRRGCLLWVTGNIYITHEFKTPEGKRLVSEDQLLADTPAQICFLLCPGSQDNLFK